ncbi:hypothetical protein ZHAS_00007043 [Anopheles sinensis]|uniref:Uncharacterized protein n=1 Tax=Anopheles sinensis TaxID=74873 RepID=A0A084VNR0_ANOSI|nr:hypothetical protein ZHAS_00007043 [Anopheles sinensis]
MSIYFSINRFTPVVGHRDPRLLRFALDPDRFSSPHARESDLLRDPKIYRTSKTVPPKRLGAWPSVDGALGSLQQHHPAGSGGPLLDAGAFFKTRLSVRNRLADIYPMRNFEPY